MAKKAEQLAYKMAARVISRIGVSKAAASGLYLDDLATSFLPAAEVSIQFRKQIRQSRKQIRQLTKQAGAMLTPPTPRGFAQLDPAQWQAELARRVPPKPVNGYHFDTRSPDGQAPPPGHPG